MHLERLGCRRDEYEAIELERFACIGRQKKVADMGRVERSAEDPNSHLARSLVSRARARRLC